MLVDPDDDDRKSGDWIYLHEEVALYALDALLLVLWAAMSPATFVLGLILAMPIGYIVGMAWTLWRANVDGLR